MPPTTTTSVPVVFISEPPVSIATLLTLGATYDVVCDDAVLF